MRVDGLGTAGVGGGGWVRGVELVGTFLLSFLVFVLVKVIDLFCRCRYGLYYDQKEEYIAYSIARFLNKLSRT